MYFSIMKNTLLLLLSILTLSQCNSGIDETNNTTEIMAQSDSILHSFSHFEFPGTTIRALKVVDEHTVYFAGSNGIWGYTKDTGHTWHTDTIEQNEFRSIEVTPNENIFLVSVQNPATIFRSTNNGKTFNASLVLPDTMFIDQVKFSNNSTGVVISDPVQGYFQIHTTHNGGFTWEKVNGEFRPKALQNEYPFAASNSVLDTRHQHIWFCTGGPNQARVHMSNNYGQTWFVNNTPIVSNDNMTGIYALHMHTDSIGLISGGNWDSIPQTVVNMAITSDGGKTWKELTPNNTLGYISDIDFIPDNKCQRIIALQGSAKNNSTSAIFYSPDRGKTWKRYENPNQYLTIRFANKNIAWLAGKNGIGRVEITY